MTLRQHLTVVVLKLSLANDTNITQKNRETHLIGLIPSYLVIQKICFNISTI